MSLQRLSSWLLKESGKTFVFGCAIAANGVIISLNIVPQTFLLDKYKEIVCLYKNGFTVPVPQTLKTRFEKTLDLLEIDESNKKQFKPFMVFGFNLFSAGTYSSRYGVIIGLPINYTYIDADYIDTSGIQIVHNSVAWETDEGKLLLKSLTLSEEAQMYGMAREIQLKQTPQYYINMLSSVINFISAYTVGHHINTKFDLYAKPRLIRFIMYGLLGSFACVNYLLIKDCSQLQYEKKVDKYLKNKHPVFKQGGIDFYTASLNRNIALRTLMGKVGESNYTILGNETCLIRQKHLPLMQRKLFFESNVDTF